MPERTVLPKPYQKPHPPMWVAVTSVGTEIDAAERGLGSLGLSFGGVGEQAQKIAGYRKRIQSCDPVGEFVNEQVNTVSFLYCHEDDEKGITTGQQLAGTFNYLSEQTLATRQAYPTPSYLSPGLLYQLRRESTGGPEGRVPEGLTIGDPHRVAEAVRRWEEAGVDRINFLLNVAEMVPQEDVLASMRLFAKEVMPQFQDAKTPEPAEATAAGGA